MENSFQAKNNEISKLSSSLHKLIKERTKTLRHQNSNIFSALDQQQKEYLNISLPLEEIQLLITDVLKKQASPETKSLHENIRNTNTSVRRTRMSQDTIDLQSKTDDLFKITSYGEKEFITQHPPVLRNKLTILTKQASDLNESQTLINKKKLIERILDNPKINDWLDNIMNKYNKDIIQKGSYLNQERTNSNNLFNNLNISDFDDINDQSIHIGEFSVLDINNNGITKINNVKNSVMEKSVPKENPEIMKMIPSTFVLEESSQLTAVIRKNSKLQAYQPRTEKKMEHRSKNKSMIYSSKKNLSFSNEQIFNRELNQSFIINNKSTVKMEPIQNRSLLKTGSIAYNKNKNDLKIENRYDVEKRMSESASKNTFSIRFKQQYAQKIVMQQGKLMINNMKSNYAK